MHSLSKVNMYGISVKLCSVSDLQESILRKVESRLIEKCCVRQCSVWDGLKFRVWWKAHNLTKYLEGRKFRKKEYEDSDSYAVKLCNLWIWVILDEDDE